MILAHLQKRFHDPRCSGSSIRFIASKSGFSFLVESCQRCTNQQPPQRRGTIPVPVWGGSKLLLAFAGVPVTPGAPFIQTIFSPCCPLNDRRRAALSLFKLFSLLLPLSLARILFLLLSGNVCSNLGPVYPCSVCAGNVTCRGRSVQCCTCSKWIHLR